MVEHTYKNFTFKGHSEGGIQTCISVSPLNLAFDIGRCPGHVVQLPMVLLTHGHLDHSAGIPYYISQRALRNNPPPVIYMPAELKPNLEQIMKIYSDIEGFIPRFEIKEAIPEERVNLNGKYFFSCRPTRHRVPSVGYTIFETVQKLKDEYQGAGKDEIIALKKDGVSVTRSVDTPVISFSGDTKIEYILENEIVRKSKILFLECTYIDSARTVERTREWGHIHLDEIIEHADKFENERIFLIHFSIRYSHRYINRILEEKLPPSLKEKVVPFI